MLLHKTSSSSSHDAARDNKSSSSTDTPSHADDIHPRSSNKQYAAFQKRISPSSSHTRRLLNNKLGDSSGGKSSDKKKQKMIVLSDSEEEKRGDVDDDEEKRSELNKEDVPDAAAYATNGSSIKQIQWWERKLPRSLHREEETTWHLALHCKYRTQLYHTLLHYKFRLLLKIREYLQRQPECIGKELEQVSTDQLTAMVYKLADDHYFVDQEVQRFNSLLKTAGRHYGGERYEDIWDQEEDDEVDMRGSGNKAGQLQIIRKHSPNSSSSHYKQQTSISSWLVSGLPKDHKSNENDK